MFDGIIMIIMGLALLPFMFISMKCNGKGEGFVMWLFLMGWFTIGMIVMGIGRLM